MKARERYSKIFGRIDSLAAPVPWTTGVSNMLEWLLWSTNDVLGVTKTKYRKKIVAWCEDEAVRDADVERKQHYVAEQLKAELTASEMPNRYDRPSSSVATPREALRRAKFFSEDYLNKEFDIFWGLVSDRYLDEYYGQFTTLKPGGRWFSHGNSGLFACSTGISEMQMDNLSYNPSANILIANELKLGGRKNPDQILKYALMYRLLAQGGFVAPDTRFLLLFVGDKQEKLDRESLIRAEVAHCRCSTKSTARSALHPEGLRIAKSADYTSTTWDDLIAFNTRYISSLSLPAQQVEQKLIWGFNEALVAKAFLQWRRA